MIKLANRPGRGRVFQAFSRAPEEFPGFPCASLPDGVTGGVGVMGGDPPDGGAHPGVF